MESASNAADHAAVDGAARHIVLRKFGMRCRPSRALCGVTRIRWRCKTQYNIDTRQPSALALQHPHQVSETVTPDTGLEQTIDPSSTGKKKKGGTGKKKKRPRVLNDLAVCCCAYAVVLAMMASILAILWMIKCSSKDMPNSVRKSAKITTPAVKNLAKKQTNKIHLNSDAGNTKTTSATFVLNNFISNETQAIWATFGLTAGVSVHNRSKDARPIAFAHPCESLFSVKRATHSVPVVFSKTDRAERAKHYHNEAQQQESINTQNDSNVQIWPGEPYTHDSKQSFFHLPTRAKTLATIEEYFPSVDPFTIPTNSDYLYESCAVVGNSGILTSNLVDETGAAVSSRGAEIDQHAAVIRFHTAPTTGYEQHVGNKTTLRFVSDGGMGVSYLMELAEAFERNATLGLEHSRKILRTSGGLGVIHNYVKFLEKLESLPHRSRERARQLVHIMHDDFYRHCWICLFELYLFAKLKGYSFGADKGVDISGTPSTGVHAAMFAMMKCKKVTLYGFGSYQGAPYKYYRPEDICCPTSMHDMHSELEAVTLLGRLWLREDFHVVTPHLTLRSEKKLTRTQFNDELKKRNRRAKVGLTNSTKQLDPQRRTIQPKQWRLLNCEHRRVKVALFIGVLAATSLLCAMICNLGNMGAPSKRRIVHDKAKRATVDNTSQTEV